MEQQGYSVKIWKEYLKIIHFSYFNVLADDRYLSQSLDAGIILQLQTLKTLAMNLERNLSYYHQTHRFYSNDLVLITCHFAVNYR